MNTCLSYPLPPTFSPSPFTTIGVTIKQICFFAFRKLDCTLVTSLLKSKRESYVHKQAILCSYSWSQAPLGYLYISKQQWQDTQLDRVFPVSHFPLDSDILVESVDSVRNCAGRQSGNQVGGQNRKKQFFYQNSIINFFCPSDFSFQFEIKNK